MTVDDLYAMFSRKQQKPSPGNIQSGAPSSPIRQARITAYFKPVTLKASGAPNSVAKPFSAMSSTKCKKRISATQSSASPTMPSASQSAQALPNQKPGTSHMATDNVSSLKRQLNAPKYQPAAAAKAPIGQQYLPTAG